MMLDNISEIQIPPEWERNGFRHIFEFGKGLNITKEDLTDEGTPVISYGQVHSKSNSGVGISEDLIRYVPIAYEKTNPQCMVNYGDFIFADTSEDLEGVGNCVHVDYDGKMFSGYHTIIARLKEEQYYSKYFAFEFLTDFWRAQLRSKVMGVKVFSVTKRFLRETSMIIPPYAEQKVIADFLDKECARIDSIAADLEKQIELLQQYKKSLITETVTKGLDKSVPMKDSGIEGIGDIPNHWNVKRLKYLASVKTGPFGTQLSADEYSDEGIPVINVKNIGYGKILSEDLDHLPADVAERLSQHRLIVNDIVFGRKGAVDKHAIVTEQYAGWVQGSDCIRVRSIQSIDSRYLNYLFDTRYFAEYVVLYAVGTTMASINSDILTNSKVLIPPLEEQSNISDFLDKHCEVLASILTNKQQELKALQAHKKSLIYEYVTGKKRVKEAQ